MNGTSAMHKQPMNAHPPRLNRSLSTPAKFGGSYLNYGAGSNLPSLEENPFFRMQDAASHNGLMALAVSFQSIKTYWIIATLPHPGY